MSRKKAKKSNIFTPISQALGWGMMGKKHTVIFAKDRKTRVRVTRTRRPTKSERSIDLRVTIGPPNYQEREYLKLCKKGKTQPKTPWFPRPHFKDQV